MGGVALPSVPGGAVAAAAALGWVRVGRVARGAEIGAGSGCPGLWRCEVGLPSVPGAAAAGLPAGKGSGRGARLIPPPPPNSLHPARRKLHLVPLVVPDDDHAGSVVIPVERTP